MVAEVDVSAPSVTQVELRLDPLYHITGVFVSVAGEPVGEDDLYQAASSLSGRALRAALEPSLGETLSSQPGVNATYFGPASSRPVIRGLTGNRVRVLEAGVGTGDASTASPDHAVSVESQLAERIEVIRRPATLLYGSSAIGGIVNVFDNRIPDELPGAAVTGQLISAAGTVADERNVSAELNGGAGRIAWHASALFRDTDDYAVPGGGGGVEGLGGMLENSALETSRGALGISYVGGNGYVGLSGSGYDSRYGVPGGEAEEGEAEQVAIDLSQRRLDLRGGWRFGMDVLRGLRLRFGSSDYRHLELEGEDPGTRFENDEWEARVEALTHVASSVHGAVGLQLGDRDFSAVGEETFTPPANVGQVGLFAFQELDLGRFSIQVGARYEARSVTSKESEETLDYDDASLSTGLSWDASDNVDLALSVSRSVKFPTVEELFSDGPHLASRSFEVGAPGLRPETVRSVDLTMRIHSGRLHGDIAGFVNRFTDFIYQEFTGAVEEGLTVLRYTQGDAVFAGMEGRLELDVLETAGLQVKVYTTGDYVWAELTGPGEPLPRIPPLRVGGGVEVTGAAMNVRLGVRGVSRQDRIAPNEDPTAGYSMLDGQVAYRIMRGSFLHEVTLLGRNLTNQLARNHISLLKESAPLPGREVRLMYRLAF